MWWLERPDGTQVDLRFEGLSRNDLIDAWLRRPANTAGVNRGVLTKQVRASVSGLARLEPVRARLGDAVAAAARKDVRRPLHDSDVLEGLARLLEDLAGPLARYSVHTGRLIFERHLCPEGLPTAVRREFENDSRDRLASAVREELLSRGPALDVASLVEGEIEPALVEAVRHQLGDWVLTFAGTEPSPDARAVLVDLAYEMNSGAVAAVDPRDVVPEDEQARLRSLLDEAHREVGRGPLWGRWARTDAEEILQEAAVKTLRQALRATAAGSRVEKLFGLLYQNIGFVQRDHDDRAQVRGRRETLTDFTAPGAAGDAGRASPGPAAADHAWAQLRSGQQRAILARVAGRLEAKGSWEAICAAVILRNPTTDEIQAAVSDVGRWLSERVAGWPPNTALDVIADGPATAGVEVVRLLREALLAEPDLWAFLGIGPGEPL
ncbi:hypothetical protein E4P40_10530 [Blastococcus sp. CT_GayMR20]|uniref:hypothetical protein n=1 Tax=Blastococcus sp. CT_GayMR20 TaxID=2559609 RepID=UPI001073BF84|nr:hypothetical protein [Blastococcus sp. CT_GayMR20]TFV88057.1 hypothetical protein E4P40_10530 [Blastococcus sp. CT_GayMR20]